MCRFIFMLSSEVDRIEALHPGGVMQQSIRTSITQVHLTKVASTLQALHHQPKRHRHSCTASCKAGRRSPLIMAANAPSTSTNAVNQSNTQTTAAEDLVQYIVLRKDLWTEKQWPLGSVVAQGCHASTAALWLSRESQATKAYCAPDKLDSMHKVRSSNTCSPVWHRLIR